MNTLAFIAACLLCLLLGLFVSACFALCRISELMREVDDLEYELLKYQRPRDASGRFVSGV